MPETVFQESATKVAIGFFASIKIFENTAFDHVTEVPIYMVMWKLLLTKGDKNELLLHTNVQSCTKYTQRKVKIRKLNCNFVPGINVKNSFPNYNTFFHCHST